MNSDTGRAAQHLVADEIGSDKIELVSVGIKDISGSVSEPNLQSADDNQNQLVDILVDLDQLHDHTFGIEHKDRKRQASESQASEAPSIRSAKHQSKVR